VASVGRDTTSVLVGGIKGLVTCDSGDVVAGIVEFVLSQHRSLRLAAAVLNSARRTPIADAVMLANGFRCFLGVQPNRAPAGAVTIARLSNEQRAIDDLKRMLPAQSWSAFEFGWRPAAAVRAMPSLTRTARTWPAIARVARRIHRRYGAFHAYRVVELLCYYERYSQLFANRAVELAVMSSHSNPHGIAFNVAARRFGIPVLLITHGMPISPIARLDYDIAIMECLASADVYRRAGCRLGRVLIKSRKRDYVPMAACASGTPLRIGIFLSKDPDRGRLISTVRALLEHPSVASILVRPHPTNLWGGLVDSVSALHATRVSVSAAGSPFDDVRRCDAVIAANSTVHVEALVAGTPSCYLRGLDHAPYDVQSFVKSGLVYDLENPSRFDAADVSRFYGRPEWPAVLRQYANVDQDDDDVASSVRAAVMALGVRCAA
jgi:hypothetical protein